MKKALIISYYWPPSGGAGVQRWLKFVKYMRHFGWEPILYVPENPEYPETDLSLATDVPAGLTILRHPIWEPYNAYKRLIGSKPGEKINAAFLSEKKKNRFLEAISVWIRGNLFIPDARKYWIRPSIVTLSQFIAKSPPDAIISTGPPHSMHLIAMPLAAKFSIPWLADFRDPWTNIDFYKDLRLTRFADVRHRRLEKEVVKKANAVTVISNTMADDFRRIADRKYTVITNGYDEEDIDTEKTITPDTRFSIAHIGTLVSTRNPETLWQALKELLVETEGLADDLEIKLVGKVDITVIESIDRHDLTPYLRRIDYMPHNQVVECQRQSQVLLLIINNTPNAKMILTGKFFEYLAAGRPILCLGPEEGDAATILNETKAGMVAGFGDIQLMKRHLLELYTQFRNGQLVANGMNIGRFSRRELTHELCSLLDDITGKSATV